MKILAHYDEFTGSHYHRIHLPILHLERHYPEHEIIRKKELREADFANCDILFYNRFIKIPIFNLNLLRKKYGFKIIIDMDDKVFIPKNHYMYNFYEQQKIPEKIVTNLINADYITCSTEYLANELKQYNSNIIVVPNAIDFEIDQFKLKEKELNDKLRVIYPCSLSHVHDVKLLETSFKKIRNDSFTNNNTIFTLAGYNEGNKQTKTIWDKMKDVYKKLGKYNISKSLTTDQYMAHYDNQDVCTIPLEVTDFNKSKSILKLLEAGSKKLAVIASNVEPYSLIPEGYYLPVNNNTDWYMHIKEMLKNKQMIIDYSEKLYEFVVSNYNMNDVNKIRKDLFESASNTVNIKQTKIISVCYNSNQFTEYERYMNPVKTIKDRSYLFEYNPIIEIINKNLYNVNDYKYIGIFSWKFCNKTGFSERELYYNIDGVHDVYIFVKSIFKNGKEYFDYSFNFHGQVLKELIQYICQDLNIEFTDSPEYAVFSNFYVARYDILKDYVNSYVIPTIDLLETKYKESAWLNSKYMNLKPEELFSNTGLTYYPLHSFILERMFSIYLHNNKNLKVKNCIGSY